MNTPTKKYEYLLVGGGLQAGLLALAIDHYQPDAKVLMLERDERLFGNHTWSFHSSDVEEEWKWLHQLPNHQWPAYTVHFPGFDRLVKLPYCSSSSAQFDSAIESIVDRGNLEIKTSVTVSELANQRAVTTSGEEFLGDCVIDCRGRRSDKIFGAGFQTFFGIEVDLEQDWPHQLPVLMEANVDQSDGYRFLYVLPFTSRRVLIEETRFSDSQTVNKVDAIIQINSYLKQKSVSNWRVVREEEGCLPMPFTSANEPTSSACLSGGFAGGWFHAATGYSFPLAARFADMIASGTPQQAQQRVAQLANSNQFQSKFSRFLNRLLFRLVRPERRYEVFRRFYNVLPNETIQRFYAHKFTKTDAARIMIGSPPRALTPIRFLQSFKATSCPV